MEEKLIYVVDDEKDIREMERTFLENEGYRVEIFSDADEALGKMGFSFEDDSSKVMYRSAFLAEKPDLIIMDIMMPGTNGLTACNRIRKASDSVLSVMPIILVSAKDTPLDRVTGLTMGSDDYLIKPFLPLELVARVKALLRRSEILREKIFYTAGKSSLSGESAEIFTPDKPRDLNGGENQQLCGDDEEKCGNLVMNYAARRVYVIDFRKELHNDGFRKKENVEKNTKKPGLKGTDIMEVQLTPMEFDFLYYLILRKETAVSKAELLENVWHFPDAELRDDVRMTDDLLKRLRKKLRAAGSSARVETVWGFGYRLTEN